MSRLSKEKLDEFYVRRIQPGLAKHGRGRPPWRKPTVLFILGQPGAGKTTMQAAAMDRLGMKKAYVLDHDELLEKHPEYARGRSTTTTPRRWAMPRTRRSGAGGRSATCRHGGWTSSCRTRSATSS
jgi:hypothetical protein